MGNQFQIIEKISEDKKVYYLRKIVFGISIYKWSYINFTGSFLGVLIIASNIMSYAFVSSGVSLLIHVASIILAYKLGRKKYNSINEAENVIKEYVKKHTLKANKPKALVMKSNVLNYNIDIEKGVFEKEFHSRTEK
jgi:hypothetical protein